jgi:hypothetical protein
MLTLVIPSPVYTPTSVSSWLPVHGIQILVGSGVDQKLTASFKGLVWTAKMDRPERVGAVKMTLVNLRCEYGALLSYSTVIYCKRSALRIKIDREEYPLPPTIEMLYRCSYT